MGKWRAVGMEIVLVSVGERCCGGCCWWRSASAERKVREGVCVCGVDLGGVCPWFGSGRGGRGRAVCLKTCSHASCQGGLADLMAVAVPVTRGAEGGNRSGIRYKQDGPVELVGGQHNGSEGIVLIRGGRETLQALCKILGRLLLTARMCCGFSLAVCL